jgi:hypothetical protein
MQWTYTPISIFELKYFRHWHSSGECAQLDDHVTLIAMIEKMVDISE